MNRAPQILNHFVEHFHVGLVAHGAQISRLLASQKVPRSANFQVHVGQPEAAAQFRQILNCFQPSLGIAAKFPHRGGDEQVRIGAARTPPHPASQLVELGQAQGIGAVDDNRIGLGNIETALNDGGTQENIGIAAYERVHAVLKGVLLHLAMGDYDRDLRHHSREHVRHAGDGRHAIV